MKTVVGIFPSRQDAERAIESLRAAGIPDKRLNLLTPASSEGQVHAVPTTETEQPGMGKAVGGVVGGVFGATTGLGLAEAAASLLIPGVGPVAAIGLAAAALFGAGGAALGVAAGGALEENIFRGLPKDELYLYEDALRQGRSVVIAFADGDEQEEAARRAVEGSGAESLDAARERWWVGLRPVEEAEYRAEGEEADDFRTVETEYRRGFEAALRADRRGKSYEEVADELRRHNGDIAGRAAFRRGFERGHAYHRRMREGSSPRAANR